MRINYCCPACQNSGRVQGFNPEDPFWIAPLTWEAAEVEMKCEQCGLVLYQDSNAFTLAEHGMPVGVCLLVQDAQGLLLAVSRKDDPTQFGLPGGKVDPTDGDLAPNTRAGTLRRACAREAWEECGLNLDPTTLQFVHQGVCLGGADGIAYWMVTLTCALPHEPMQQPGEGNLAWVPWSVLEQGPFGRINKLLHATWDAFIPE